MDIFLACDVFYVLEISMYYAMRKSKYKHHAAHFGL